MKKVLAMVLAICVVCGTSDMYAFAESRQAVETRQGETVNGNGVSISKSLSETGIENVFDISLCVTTEEAVHTLYEDADMAIAIVMDISGTMCQLPTEDAGRQYKDAVAAAKSFIADYCNDAEGKTAVRDLTLITFNTNAKVQQGLTDCSSEGASFDAAFESIDCDVKFDGTDFDNEYRLHSHDRFTNIEAGLRLARNVLNDSQSENKFIILLTDGYPTTYCEGHNSTSIEQISGYDPYVSSGNIGDDGYFYDALTGRPCNGTSYSDKAALYAQQEAAAIKAEGTTVFTVGINIGAQQISSFIRDHEEQNFSIVDCFADSSAAGSYQRDTDNPGCIVADSSEYVIGSSTAAYEDWLKNALSSKSTYYCNADDTAELKKAYEEFSETIESVIASASEVQWVVSDPMGEGIEFLSFIDNNTATYQNGIYWDLKKVAYEKTETADGVKFVYKLSYRLRLKNELEGFVEGATVKTNGKTVLKYQHRENGRLESQEDLIFPEPSVKGYLGKLSFTKLGGNTGLSGAEFTLTHADDCSVCYKIGKSVAVAVANATSSPEVVFANIPSGHEYILTETKVPQGYVDENISYRIKLAYGTITTDGKEAFDTVKNTPLTPPHIPSGATTMRTVHKLWNDSGYEAERPTQVEVQLYKDGRAYGEAVSLSDDNGWSYTWLGLPKGSKYEVKELSKSDKYSSAVTEDGSYGFLLSNTRYKAEEPEERPKQVKASENTESVTQSSEAAAESKSEADVPKTGDNALLPGSILGLSAAGAGILLVKKKQKKL